jgi:hypothetical protein
LHLRLEKKERYFLQSTSNQQAFHGQKVKLSEVEEKHSCLNERQQFGYAVSSEMCQLKVLQTAKGRIQGFNASQGWMQKFPKLNYKKVNKHCTKVYKEKLSVFQKYQYHSLVQ